MQKERFLKRTSRIMKKYVSCYSSNNDYIACKTKLDNIYDKKVEGLRIRSNCYW